VTVLEFIASIVASLSWPLAVAVLVLVLRKHIDHLMPRLRSVAISRVRAEFGEVLREAEVTLGSSSLPVPDSAAISHLSEGASVEDETSASNDGPGWAQRRPFNPAISTALRLSLSLDPVGTMEDAWRDLRQDMTHALWEQGYTGALNGVAVEQYEPHRVYRRPGYLSDASRGLSALSRQYASSCSTGGI
jgi:hypothetical protein